LKPFLILQLRPETDAADGEFTAILEKAGLAEDDVFRVRLDQAPLPEGLSLDDFSGVIVGGGPGCVSDPPEAKSPMDARIEGAVMSLMPEITARDFPFMGCCYGIGILAHHLGAEVSKRRFGEPVCARVCELTEDGAKDPLLTGLPERFEVFLGHKEAVQEQPRGTVHLMRSAHCPFQMIRFGENVYATQFHPEADAAVFEERIRIYRDYGYFPPEDADALTAACHAADVVHPGTILRRFAARYG
jgi:GMP synthase (glutamine-hydrolysing)